MFTILTCSPRNVTLAVVLAAFVPGQATAQSSLERFQLFNECSPMDLVVEYLSDDAAAIDLTKERIETLAESRLRAARLYDAEGDAHLYIRVGVLVSENRRGGAYSIEVNFRKHLYDAASDVTASAQTWDVGSIGTHGGDAGNICKGCQRT